MPDAISTRLRDPGRLAALRATGLLDSLPAESIDRLTRIAANLLSVPAAFVSLVDEDRDFFLSQTGFPEPLASTRQMTGLTFCHYAIGREEPLLIPDTRADPRYCGVPAVESFGVAAYAGVPLRLARGETIGALCAIDTAPRPWTETEVAALRDLAACVVAEIELREATARAERERLERDVLLESALEGIYGMDLEGRCTFINRAGAQMLGYTPGEIAGRNMHALIHHTRLDGRPYPASECPIRRASLTGQFSQVEAEALWRKDGSHFIAEYGCSPLASEGLSGGAVVTFRDITERSRAEAALRETEARYRVLAETASDAILIIDEEHAIIFANPAAERIFGYAPEELVGRPLSILIPERLREAHRRGMNRYRTTGQRGIPWTGIELPGLRKDGSEIAAELSFGEYSQDGRRFFSGIFRDITEKKRMEEKLHTASRMESVGRLAGGVAHDFNNLLTVIRGNTELLLMDRAGDAPLTADLGEIQRAAEHAAGLTRQLLAFSRQQSLKPSRVDLNEVVPGMHRMLGRLLGEDVHIVVRTQPNLWPVMAAAGQLEQVIVNLAVNARDAMPGGGTLGIESANVPVRAANQHEHPGTLIGDYVRLCVTDTGTGIDERTRSHMFEPFFTTKEVGKGTGLGLAMVYGIVKQSGGYISVESTPGEGTRFRIYLPRLAGEAGNPPAPGVPPRKARGGTETVLLVEDEDAVRLVAARVLRRSGYTVLEATNWKQGISAFRDHSGFVDLLLTDVVMPDANGRELAEALQRERPGLRVLYMSGYTSDAVLQRGIREAEIAFLQKPFDIESLLEAVRSVLDGEPAGHFQKANFTTDPPTLDIAP